MRIIDWLKCILIALIIMAIVLAFTKFVIPVRADTRQQYEFGMYAYGLPTKTDKGVYVWIEAKTDDQKAMQAIIDTEDNPNLDEIFNLAGTFGWRFVSSDKQGLLTIYVFERPLDG